MSAAADSPERPRHGIPDMPRSAAGPGGPWVMTTVISIATFMEILDTSIANVALPDISGALGVSSDQGTWIVTSYLVANAIIIPISGFLSRAIGRKRYFMISVALFTLSSLVCALSTSLGMLVIARVFQGIGGGGMAPVEQSMLADSFPQEKRGQAFAFFGLVILFAPIIGPTIGGFLTDFASWHWVFLLNLPVGILSVFLTSAFVREAEPLVEETRKLREGGLKIDYVGFILIAVGLGGLLITLDRGQTEGWLDSPLIRVTAIMAIVGLGLMVAWELNHPDPIVPLTLLANRNFAICTLLIMILGLLVFGTIQIVPQMVQQVFHYSSYHAGLALTYGGWISIVMMPFAGLLTGKLDTRALLFPAFAMQAVSFWYFANFNLDSTFAQVAIGRLLSSSALPFLFIPITAAAYVGLNPGDSDKASAMINFFRNLGGAFGISLAQTLLVRREQFHQSRMTEGLNHLNPSFNEGLQQATQALGGNRDAALGAIYGQVQQQAAILSYIEVYYVLMWLVILMLPLILMLHPAKGGDAGAH